jgi:hypothetical protein
MLPAELVHPKGYARVNFALEAHSRLATLAGRLGIDLWSFRAEQHNSILVRFSPLSNACVSTSGI